MAASGSFFFFFLLLLLLYFGCKPFTGEEFFVSFVQFVVVSFAIFGVCCRYRRVLEIVGVVLVSV